MIRALFALIGSILLLGPGCMPGAPPLSPGHEPVALESRPPVPAPEKSPATGPKLSPNMQPPAPPAISAQPASPEPAKTETSCTPALSPMADEVLTWGVHATSFRAEGDSLKAIDELTAAIFRNPTSSDLRLRRAQAYWNLTPRSWERWEAAMSDVSMAIQLDARNAGAYNFRALMLIMATDESLANRLTLALVSANRALELEPLNVGALNTRGMVYAELGILNQAVENYRQAILLDPGYVSAYYNLALVSVRLNRLDQALSDFNRAIQLDGSIPAFYRSRGHFIYMETRQWDLAIADFKKTIDLDTDPASTRLAREQIFIAERLRTTGVTPGVTP